MVFTHIFGIFSLIIRNLVLLNNKMYSDFPILEEGENNISWSGNVTQIEIIPRWVVL